MSLTDLFVLAMFVLGAGSAAIVALHPNVLYAAIALVFSLLSISGMYGALGADFLAGAQLIIYVGGIIVVILFAIMMSENIYRRKFIDNAGNLAVPFVVSFLVLLGIQKLIGAANWELKEVIRWAPTSDGIGRALVGPYAVIFQYVSIVLLAGLIGAVVVARPHYHEDHHHPKEGE